MPWLTIREFALPRLLFLEHVYLFLTLKRSEAKVGIEALPLHLLACLQVGVRALAKYIFDSNVGAVMVSGVGFLELVV